MSDEFKLVSAKITGPDLVINTDNGRDEKFNLRRITAIELQHDIEHGSNVRAYVGYNDPERQSVFAARTVDRRFVGLFNEQTQDIDQVRTVFTTLGVPIIEF